MPDQMVRDVAQVVGGDDRAGELFQRVGVDLLDGFDQVVEPDRAGHARWLPHASTVG